jgi:hypothetical protein
MSASIIICADAKEQTEKIHAYKKFAKDNGTFAKVVKNTVVLKGGDSVSFVIEDAPKMDDEPVLYGGSMSGGISKAGYAIQHRKYAPIEKVGLPLSDDTKILADAHGFYAEPDGQSMPKMEIVGEEQEPVLYGGYRDMRDVCGEIDVSKEAPEAARIRKTVRDMME